MVNINSALSAYNNQMKLAQGMESLGTEDKATGPSFSDFLGNQVQDFVNTQQVADVAKMEAVTGKGDIADLVTAIANAELALNTIVTIRDKAIGAYQEIIRMPI